MDSSATCSTSRWSTATRPRWARSTGSSPSCARARRRGSPSSRSAAIALARRLGPRLGRLVSRLSARLGGAAHRDPCRIAWHRVRDIGVDIGLDLDVHDTTVFDWQDWLRDHVIGKIPGA